LIIAGALLDRPVEIVVARIAAFMGGFNIGIGQRMVVAHVRHRERSTSAVIGILPALVVLRLAEIRQYFVKTPTGVTHLAPIVEIVGLAAVIDQSVDRARPAQHLAPWCYNLAAVTFRLRLG